LLDSGVPFPVSYYPLEDGDLNSWPFSLDMDPSAQQALVIQDEIFGEVIDCSGNNSIVKL